MQYHLNLAHLYGDLLNTYSDIGNIRRWWAIRRAQG